MPQRTTLSRAATAALAIALSTGLSAGTLVLAVPASAAVAQAPLSAAETRKRQHITNTFNAMNAFRASKGLSPVKLGLDHSELLQETVDDWNVNADGPESILYSKRVRGYSSFNYGSALLGDPNAWIQNLLADAGKNVVGIATDSSHVTMTTYAYRTVPAQTFDTAAAYFAYLDLPQLQGPEPKLLGTAAWGNTLTADSGAWPAGTKLEYRWLHTNAGGFTSLTENTAKTNLLSDDATGNKVSVRVTATLPGHRAAVLYSTLTAPIQKAVAVRNTKAPAITGAREAGQKLAVNPGTWEAGTTLTYQWYEQYGTLPGGGTSSTYTPTRAGKLSVAVTGSKPGMRSTTVRTAEVDIIDINSEVPTQTIGDAFTTREGAPSVGENFNAWYTGKWMPGTALALQWTRNGTPIPGATGTRYQLASADVGTRIALSVTGTRAGNRPRTVSAAPSETIAAKRLPVVNSKAPVIAGTGLVGKALTVNAGTWTAGTRLTYQWTVKHGVTTYPISGATAATYTPTAQDEGGLISVVVTGWKDGYTPLVFGQFGQRIPSVEVHKALVVTPRIIGPTFQVTSGTVYQGQTLTVDLWKSGARLSYQWKRNGVAIAGATLPTYKTGAGDAGTRITVTVTARLTGSKTAAATSAATTRVVQNSTQFMQVPTYSWNGALPIVGQTLRVLTPGTWTAGARITYQWKRDGAAIKGATASSYKATTADAGKLISVDVTGQTPDYLPATTSSPAVPVRAAASPGWMPPMIPGR